MWWAPARMWPAATARGMPSGARRHQGHPRRRVGNPRGREHVPHNGELPRWRRRPQRAKREPDACLRRWPASSLAHRRRLPGYWRRTPNSWPNIRCPTGWLPPLERAGWLPNGWTSPPGRRHRWGDACRARARGSRRGAPPANPRGRWQMHLWPTTATRPTARGAMTAKVAPSGRR